MLTLLFIMVFHAAGSQNILLSTLAWQDALNFLRKAKGLGIESDAITFNSIMEDFTESFVACVVGFMSRNDM